MSDRQMRELAEHAAETKHVISFVGGGGKTTLMFRLAGELAALGKKVAVTTTTHMFRPGTPECVRQRQMPEQAVWVDREAIAAVCQAFSAGKVVLAGLPDPESGKKIVGVSEEFFGKLMEAADLVLVEADGSRRLPVKVPRAWEPVIPEQTDLTIAVLGLSALDQPVNICGYQPEELAAFLKKESSECLTEEDLERILVSEEGLRKGAAGEYLVILNQGDTAELRRRGERILANLENKGIRGFVTCRRERLAVILLAAGRGSRFGGEKIFAGAADGKTFLGTAMEKAETVRGKHILVCRHERARELAEERSVPWTAVVNERPEEGISRSIRLGVEAAGEMDGYLFLVCDQPFLSEQTLERMEKAWKDLRGDVITASFSGIPGNPKLFSAVYREELRNLQGDEGGRQIVREHRNSLAFVEAAAEEELTDLDTRERYLEYFGENN